MTLTLTITMRVDTARLLCVVEGGWPWRWFSASLWYGRQGPPRAAYSQPLTLMVDDAACCDRPKECVCHREHLKGVIIDDAPVEPDA